LWPQNSRTEWNVPRQWKRRANWKVRLLYGAGAMNELVKEIDKYEIDICAVQELNDQGKEMCTKVNFKRILY